MTVDITGRDQLEIPLEGLEGATGYAVRVSLDPGFPSDETQKREFTTRHGNLREGPDSLDHTHELTPYYENGERQGFTLDWTQPIVGYDGVTGYRIVRYYHGDQQPRPREIGPQPPVTLTEDTGSQDTEYIDRGPLANGAYTYVIWALDQVGPGPEYSLGRATVTDALDPPEPPVNATAEAFPDRVELDWDVPPGDNPPTGYAVEREVLGERGTGQVNQFETVRDDRRDDRTEYIDYIQAGSRHPGGLLRVLAGHTRLPQRASQIVLNPGAGGPAPPGPRGRCQRRAHYLAAAGGVPGRAGRGRESAGEGGTHRRGDADGHHRVGVARRPVGHQVQD